jgi:Spy/CpxP family protein refolding chaperone
MRTTLLLLFLLTPLTLAAQPFEPPPHGRRGNGPEMLPPPNWWRDPYLSDRLDLTAEQTKQLDRLHSGGKEEVARLEKEMTTAEREFRAALDEKTAKIDRIVAAGNRLAAAKDKLLRRQVSTLAAQRAVLTHGQWSALQKQLEKRRPPR